MPKLREALAEPSEITGRMDLVKTGAPFEVIIDYAHSPDSLEKLLQTVKDIHPDGRWNSSCSAPTETGTRPNAR